MIGRIYRQPFLHRRALAGVEGRSLICGDEGPYPIGRELHDQPAAGQHREYLVVDLEGRRSEGLCCTARGCRRGHSGLADEKIDQVGEVVLGRSRSTCHSAIVTGWFTGPCGRQRRLVFAEELEHGRGEFGRRGRMHIMPGRDGYDRAPGHSAGDLLELLG